MEKTSSEISWASASRFFLIGIGLLAIYYFRDIIALVLSAVVIAAAIEAPASFLMRRGWPRFAAVSLIYAAGLVLFAVILYFTAPMVLDQTRDLAKTLLGVLQGIEIPLLIPDIKEFLNGISENFTATLPAIGRGAGQVLTFLSGAVGMFFGAALVFIISFYLSLQEKWVEKALRALAPKQYEEYLIDLWERTEQKIGKWFYSQIILSLIVGSLVFIGLSFLKVESALLLAILTGAFDIVPIAGPLFVGIIAFIVAIQQGFDVGIYTLILFAVVQQLEAYVFSPVIRQKAIGLNPVAIILSLLVGARVAGFWGLLIAIPIAAAVSEFFLDFERRRLQG